MTSIPSAATTIASKTPEEKAADYFREWKRWPDGPVPEEKESKSEDKGDNPKEEKQPFDLPVENPTYEKFTLEVKDKIGSGGFGQVNHGILHSSPDKDKKHEVAIKSSKDDKGRNPVEEEFAKYKDLELDVEFDMEKEEHIEKLKNADQFPHVFCGFRWPGHSEYYIMVLQRLGTNLHSVVRKMPKGNTMDHGDVADIGIKVIKILKRLHEAGYVHSDVKPENLLYGWNEDRGDDDREKLFLIDLGLAVKWKNDKQQSGPDNHVEYNQQPNNFRGTTQYASVHAHLGRTGSRRDDLQSLAYTLLFLKCGRLPWPEKRNYKELTGDSKEKKFKKRMCTCKTKMSYSPRRLSNLWEESTKEWFREFLELVMNLKFQEVPDYDKYISLLDKIKNKILKDYQEPSPATEDPPAWISVYNYQQSMKQRYHYNIAWDNKVISRYIKKDLDEKLFICSATSHEKLALITMEKTGYTKQEYMILDLDKLKDIKLDENYTITALAATGERWLVTMAQGTTFPNQKFCVASDFFPEKFIAENRGSFVTALAANEEKWAVVLSQSPVVSSEEEQVIEFDFCIPMEGLHERFKQGYKISMVAASKNQIAFVLSRPVTATSWTPKKKLL